MHDQSDNTHTCDGVEITPGLRVWSPYTMQWGTVEEGNWKYRGVIDPGGQYFNGWYYVLGDDGRSSLLNGTRFATVDTVTYTTDPQACRCGHSEIDHVCDDPSSPVTVFRPCYSCRCFQFSTLASDIRR